MRQPNLSTLGNSVKTIGSWAFYNCDNLALITIPNSVKIIGDCAFSNCDNLDKISVKSGNLLYDSRDDCNAIIVSETNTLIEGCKNTQIPNSVKSIGRAAFYECSGLASITIPNSVISIGSAAFYECSGLASITIPNSVTSISDDAFAGCSGLTSVTIGNNVTNIGSFAFDDCSNLSKIFCKGNQPPSISYNTFNNVRSSIPIYVPNGCSEAYKADNYWSKFTNIIEDKL